MNYAASAAQNIPYPTSASTVPGPRYSLGLDSDYDFEFDMQTTSPDFLPAANASGQFGSANGLPLMSETDSHSLGSFAPFSSEFYTHYKSHGQQVAQHPSSMATLPSTTAASPQSARGTGHLMGFDAETFNIPSSFRNPTVSPNAPSLLTTRLKQHIRTPLSQEQQQYMQSPVAYGHGHFKSSSVDSMANPGLCTTPSSDSSQFGGSLPFANNSCGVAIPNQLLSPNMSWLEPTKKAALRTPTVSVDNYDLEFDLQLLSPEPTSPMLFGGPEMTDVVGNDGYTPTVSPPASVLDAQRMRRRESLRAPSISLTSNHRTHPYHDRRRSSTSSNHPSPYMGSPMSPYEFAMMTSASPSSPYPSSPMFSTSPSAIDNLFLPTPQHLRGGSTSRAGSVVSSQPTANQGALLSQFTSAQQSAARAIIKYMEDHPKTAIPATYITDDLAEVKDGRGKCLIGSCAGDGKLKRVDHLYDHVRDKHFECRPYACTRCSHAFSRDHDLKRHLQIHESKSLECGTCAKSYTRLDNLQRHVQQKHGQTLGSQAFSSRFSL